jgi:hypothetical protein
MSSYFLPDLTGTDTDYLQTNIPIYIYQVGQVVEFKISPVFASSLVLKLTDGSNSTLTRNVDWVINSSDIDQTAMSQAYMKNADFADTLVKSITILTTKGVGKRLAATYQEFYLTVPNRIFDDGQPFEITPDLIKTLQSGLADVRQQMAQVTSVVTPQDSVPPLLPFDIGGTRAGNVITNETVTVNTVAGAKVIRFRQGAFFADSVVLTYQGTKLNPATDYLPIGLSPLTKSTSNVSGIYQYILLNGTYTGEVIATYHAVGGEPQIDDIKAVYDLATAIKTYLNGSKLITPETIPNTPAFRAIVARQNALEADMRKLLSGSPTYGDQSSGATVIRPIATTDANFHWWNLASLYQVQGSTDIITADQFRGRVFLPSSKISLDFTVDVNLDQTRLPVSFTTNSLVFDPTYTPFAAVSVNAPVYPLVRVIWNYDGVAFSGAILQIGLPVPTLLDRLVVENMSTTESCWLLNTDGAITSNASTGTANSPSDTAVTLPDGLSVWSPTGSSSLQITCVPKYDKGYLAYSGSSVALSSLVTTASTGGLMTVVLPSYFSRGCDVDSRDHDAVCRCRYSL